MVEALETRAEGRAAGYRGRLAGRLRCLGPARLLKLITGGLRVGVSARLAKIALAEWSAASRPDDVEEVWHGLAPPYLPLFAWLEKRAPRPDPAQAPVFRPPMLAHPLEAADLAGLQPADWRAEWKWDGIRVQIVATEGGRRLYSRGADDISGAFPEIVEAMEFHAVLDGELLVMRDGSGGAVCRSAAATEPQGRSAPGCWRDYPAAIRLYDLLFEADRGSASAAVRRAPSAAGGVVCRGRGPRGWTCRR